MGIIESLFGKKADPKSVADVKLTIGKARAEVDGHRAKRDQLARTRADVLLNGSDADLRAHDEKAAAAQRELDRLSAAMARLEELLAEAQEREAEDHVAAQVREAEAAVERYTDHLTRYEAAAVEMVAALEAMETDDALVDRIRKELKGGDHVIRVPNGVHRPGGNVPLYQKAVIPQATQDGAVFGTGSGIRYSKPQQTYDGPVHDLPAREPGAYDADGKPIDHRRWNAGAR